MKKIFSLLLVFVMIFSLAACSNNEVNVVQMSNPWQECETIEAAETLTGFPFDSIKSAEINSISTMITDTTKIIQAVFFDGENEITIRKVNDLGDYSGDYNIYENEEVVLKDDIDIIYKGNGNTYSLVIWEKDAYSYSISCCEPVEKEILESYVNVIFE